MAKEVYAFDIGNFYSVEDNPRRFHEIMRNRVYNQWPILRTMESHFSFSYDIIETYASGSISLHAYLMVPDKGHATLIKTVID